MTVADVADVLDTAPPLVAAAGDRAVTGVVTDSRVVQAGDLYVARRGAHADGADFAGAAVAAGAVGVVAERDLPGLPTLVVADADEALVRLATWVRDHSPADVVAVTGSVGKTTTKDLIATALAPSVRVVSAAGSYNNEVGVPLTVLRTRADTEVLVTELGARGVGQVAALAGWLRPRVAVVTAVAEVHLELFGTIDAIAVAKGELVESVLDDGVAVLNADDARVAAMAARTSARVVTVSARGDGRADLVAHDVVLDRHARASFVAVTPWGRHPVTLPIAGGHHVGNALLALAVAGALEVDVAAAARALATADVSTGRGRIVDAGGIVVVDDSYNANPTSTIAALASLAAMDVPGRRVAVLGVMAEIGDGHVVEHRRVGARAAAVVDTLVVVGDDAAGLAAGARSAGLDDVEVVDGPSGAVDVLAARGLAPGDAVLVKASRVAALDRVVDAVVAEAAR
jgi:UDP-N-acetylmuramoyl-tripeptide--D-alanyl-D-alanine ligase